jgi:carboxymethylenebutenolidase
MVDLTYPPATVVGQPAPTVLARPTGAPRGGIVVGMEGTGVTPWLIRTCQRLAGEGWVVAAPDQYHRTGGSNADGWMEQFQALSDDDALADVRDAADLLRSMGAERIGMIGFCMGGRLTYLAATRPDGPGLAAGVTCYGSGVHHVLGTLACPWIGLYGSADPYVPIDHVDAIRAAHGDAVTLYEGADHGFLRDGSEAYHPQAAASGWTKAIALLHEHVG